MMIEHTEALHVIDVNSGNNISSGTANKEHALNCEQNGMLQKLQDILRLRDYGRNYSGRFYRHAKS